MKNALLSIILAIIITSCTSTKDATKALQAQGFTDIEILGYSFFGCSDDDTFHTKFRARNIIGIQVEGVVCSGIFKSATIRF